MSKEFDERRLKELFTHVALAAATKRKVDEIAKGEGSVEWQVEVLRLYPDVEEGILEEILAVKAGGILRFVHMPQETHLNAARLQVFANLKAQGFDVFREPTCTRLKW